MGAGLTSVPTMCARSSGCSMMDMKDSPRFVETNMWAMASRRSGRKAWMSRRRWTACPMGAARRGPGCEGVHWVLALPQVSPQVPQENLSPSASWPLGCHPAPQGSHRTRRQHQ